MSENKTAKYIYIYIYWSNCIKLWLGIQLTFNIFKLNFKASIHTHFQICIYNNICMFFGVLFFTYYLVLTDTFYFLYNKQIDSIVVSKTESENSLSSV